jgi:predicted HAD superfamily Cof-like phosphohydrolase
MFSRVAEFHRAVGQLVADMPALPEQSIRTLRITLLEEEVGEFCAAYASDNRIEMADALADIAYIIAGTVISYGVGPRGNEPYESPYDAFLPYRHRKNKIKPDDILRDALLDYTMAEQSNNLDWIDLTLMNMLTSVFGVAWRLNIPINKVFAEVHRSNMAKLMPDGTVRKRFDGKILKAPGWVPPDIAGVLARHRT